MEEIVHPKGKVYYTVGEVAEMFDVKPSLLRYWEEQFDTLRPHRNKKGNRLYTPQNVDTIKIIYHLLKERKMKIEVARKYMKNSPEDAGRDTQIVERLLSIRSLLVEIRNDLSSGGEPVADEENVEIVVVKKRAGRVSGPVKNKAAAGEAVADASGGEDECDIGSGLSEPEAVMDEIAVAGEDAARGDGLHEIEEPDGSDEETNAGKPPFEEQPLFELAEPRDFGTVDEAMEAFISKHYDEEADEEKPEADPFAIFAAPEPETGKKEDAPDEKEEAKDKRPVIIEQTLF